jgi:hypothetical protein
VFPSPHWFAALSPGFRDEPAGTKSWVGVCKGQFEESSCCRGGGQVLGLLQELKLAIFITTTVKTSNPTENQWVFGLCPSSGILKTVLSSFLNTGRWTKSKNPAILSVMHHHRNLLESRI